MELRVAGAQLPITRDTDANLEAIFRAVDFAIAEGAGVLLTPEGSLSGYTPEIDAVTVERNLAEVTGRAEEAKLGLALGTCFIEPDDGKCYNQIRFYGSTGEYLGFHSKKLRCGSHGDPPEGEINRYAETPLRTFELDGVRVGGLICNDLWANPACTPMPDPHLTQELSKTGARVVFHAVNGGRNGSDWSQLVWQFHESNLRMRARAGDLWVVTVDNCHPTDIPSSSPSGVISPDGDWVAKADPTGEQLFVHTIHIDD